MRYNEAANEARYQFRKRKHERDDNGRIIINMTVKDDTDFLSVFSEGDTPVISSEVAEFIENSTRSVLPKEPLTLRIHSSCIDEFEQAIYKEAIKEHYLEQFIANKRELKRNTHIALLLAVAGIIVLALAVFMEYRMNSIIWTEVVDIIAWVLLWEAVDISALKNRDLRANRLRYLSFLSMDIEFFSK